MLDSEMEMRLRLKMAELGQDLMELPQKTEVSFNSENLKINIDIYKKAYLTSKPPALYAILLVPVVGD